MIPKLIVSVMNGVGSNGDAITDDYDVRREYLSHLVLKERDKVAQKFGFDPDSVTLHAGKGGIDNTEDRILGKIQAAIQPCDVLVICGFSYGAYDSTKMVRDFWKKWRNRPFSPWVGCALVDMDWPGSVLARRLVGNRITKRVGPVNFGYNVYQSIDKLGGTPVKFDLIHDNTFNVDPRFQPRQYSIECPHADHNTMDTSTFAQSALGHTLEAACVELAARTRVRDVK